MKSLSCPNTECPLHGKTGAGNITLHGFYKIKPGKRRRYLCESCGATFSSTSRTPYHRLQHRRKLFDRVAALSVEGMSKSAIARVTGISWNTVARWLKKSAKSCRRFNNQTIEGLKIPELQADEIRAIVSSKQTSVWAFATLDVWSRLWTSAVVGRRGYRNTRALLRDTARRMHGDNVPFIVTDGYEFYERAIREVFGYGCLYAQVIKTRRNDRVVKVERKPIVGASWRFEKVLSDSEDSSALNTSFIERLNLTIRQGSASLSVAHFATRDQQSYLTITLPSSVAITIF